MAVMKCKMCGGVLAITPGATVAECEYCGMKQTLPKTNDEVVQNLYNRANNLRIKCEFDKAEQLYEKILMENDADAEAYWGIVLCKYGIEYVEDPKTHKRLPTCHRTSYDAVSADADYLAAIAHADTLQKSIYEAEARAIDAIRKSVLEIAKNEKPFDVFLCYKETDENGKRTVESVIANDIYHHLSQEGLKVFYAAITLEDKLGEAYEPYIFAALNSAKVMLVIGTKPQHFSAVWVKNEWSRFLKLMKTDRTKLLIPCYKDMDAYDLPEEFSHLQAQDMGKIGFISDIVRGIKKLSPTEKAMPAAEKESDGQISPLLKRAFLFLEDGDWGSATQYCEKVLDIDPESAQAYLGKLMAELHVKKQAHLREQAKPFDGNSNYKKALRFADAALQRDLTDCLKAVQQKNEQTHAEDIYAKALAKMQSGTSARTYSEAAKLFAAIRDYKDAAALQEECSQKAETASIEAKTRAKKTRKLLLILAPCVCAVAVVLTLVFFVFLPNARYSDALALMDAGEYLKAISAFEALDGYKDSADKIAQCNAAILEGKYNDAVALLQEGHYEDAIAAFGEIQDYQDSAEKILACKYQMALALMEAGSYEEAQSAFEALKDYEDSEERIRECKYATAVALMEAEEYHDAILIFGQLYIYKDNLEKINECRYAIAVALMEDGKYNDAIVSFTRLNDYKESAAKIRECKYAMAVALMDDKNYVDARPVLEELGDYKDSKELLDFCRYDGTYTQALLWIEEGNIVSAYESLISLDGYKDSVEKAESIEKTYKRIQGKSNLFTNGTWWDVNSMRCNLSMEIINEDKISIEIDWSSSADTMSFWQFVGTWDETTGTLKYSNGVLTSYIDGDEFLEYDYGSGYLYFQDGYLYWVDYTRGAGNSCYFEQPQPRW